MTVIKDIHFEKPTANKTGAVRQIQAAILVCYLLLNISVALTGRPQTDESVYANPGYNLLHSGRMGTTLYELRGFMPLSLAERTYWQPPLYFLTTAAWYRLFGFGLLQTRFLSTLFGALVICCWCVIARSLLQSKTAQWLVPGLVAVDYFFVIGSSTGRMDIMCAALGIASIATYVSNRQKSLFSAIFWSHGLATFAILTHPAGLSYWLGLAFLVLYFDRRSLSLQHLAAAAVPCVAGGLLWGSYIAQDPAAFFAQMQGILDLNKGSFTAGHWSDIAVVRNLQKELVFRYAGPFGLTSGVGLLNRLKSLVLLAYATGVFGLLLLTRRSRDLVVFPILALLSFSYLAFASPSKFSYYLPHTTMFMAACFGVFVSHLRTWGTRPAGNLAVRMPKALLAAAVMMVAGVELSGLIYRIVQDPLHRSYLPAIAAIRKNSKPGSLVMGSGELWFQLYSERQVRYDPALGFRNHLKPSLFVMDTAYDALHERDREADPAIYAYVRDSLARSQVVYSDGYYRVYVERRGEWNAMPAP
jgi:4-amino-4-deoxy-L-arabinose transferase-like glycosyltransferase